MKTEDNVRRSWRLRRIVLPVSLWAVIVSLLNSHLFDTLVEGRFSAPIAYILSIGWSLVPVGVFGVLFVVWLAKRENVRSIRRFFTIEKLDVQGVWLAFGLLILVQGINLVFLRKFLLQPAQKLLDSWGLTGPQIGLGTVETIPALSPAYALILSLVVLIFWWVEVPEEMFFRGYVQNKLQPIVGKNTAMVLSTLLWDVSHLWALTTIVERFLTGFVYALVFRLRQNATGPMLGHALGNRALLLGLLLPQVFGRTLNPNSGEIWLWVLGTNIVLLALTIVGWQLLKLDRMSVHSEAA